MIDMRLNTASKRRQRSGLSTLRGLGCSDPGG